MGDPVAEQMAALLRYANYAKVARDMGVSRQTVMRWARGEAVSPWQLQRIRALFGIPGTEIEAAPPPWAERLAEDAAAKVISLLAAPDSPFVSRLEDQLVRDGLLAPEVRPEESAGHPVGESTTRRRSA